MDSTIGNLTQLPSVLRTHKLPVEPQEGPPARFVTIDQIITLLDEIYGSRAGLAMLVDGMVTVNNNSVTPNTVILAGFKTLIGTSAGILTWSVLPGVSFTITSVGATGAVVATDASTVGYLLVESE